MNGARSTFMRTGYWLTALAAAVLLAASPGTAAAQATLEIDSLKLATTTVEEGAEATATLKFTVTAGDAEADLVEVDDDVTISFAYVIGSDLETDTEATNAIPASFSDLSTSLSDGTAQVTITVDELAAGASESYEVEYTFGLNHDSDAEDGQFMLTGTVADWAVDPDSAESPTAVYTIKDDEEQSYTLSIPAGNKGSIVEGDTDATDVTLTIDPPRSAAATVPTFTVVMEPNDLSLYEYDSDTATLTPLDLAPAGADSLRSVPAGTIEAFGDENRVDDTVTIKLYRGIVGRNEVVHELPITVSDIHVLPDGSAVTAVAMDKDGEDVEAVVEGGDPVYLTITVDRGEGATAKTSEELTVTVEPANPGMGGDYRLSGTPVTLLAVEPADGEQSSTAEIVLTAVPDEDVGAEALMLSLVLTGHEDNGPGSSTGMFSIAITDDTTKKIYTQDEADAYPKIRAALGEDPTNTVMNPGQTGMIMTSDLFTVTDGYSDSYGVSVEGDSVSASASGDSITIDAKSAGESKVTVTGTARTASSSFAPSQTVSNVAELTFLVMVVDTELVVTLSADPMEIDEGGTSMLTATANRYVTVGDGDVEIALAVVPSDGGTLDAESIMIAMGTMSGSTMLTATADDDMDNETVTVVATGSGITGLMQVAVAVTDTTVPVVPEPEPVSNQISAKDQDEAYPVIMAAIAAGAGEDEMLTPGESVELMASDLFTVMDGYTASYRVSVDSAAVSGLADGDSISVTAVSAGDAKVTITGTAKMAASSFDASQDATNVASITFPVTVEAEPEPVVPEPVPALPVIAQWLLGLGLMGGGARQLFRRRRQG